MQGLPVERVNKVAEGQPHIVDKIIDGDIALIFNTTEGWQSLKDSQSIRAGGARPRCLTTPPRRQRGSGAGDRFRRSADSLKSARCRTIMLT
jgi:hypothetical protein